MKKDTIFQFVCFITNLGLDEFAPKWEYYASKLGNKKKEPSLQQLAEGMKGRFRYISQHEWPCMDFQFSFMENRKNENFPEHNVKVVQTGGYTALLNERRNLVESDDIKIIAFLSHNDHDIEGYTRLSLYHQLNIYQAFYESCAYGYVLEFFLPENKAGELLLQLKQHSGTETGIYKDCLVPQE